MNSLPTAPGASTSAQMVAWVRATLGTDFPPDTNGLWQPGDGRPVQRLGVALIGSHAVAERARLERIDALLLHRPWRLGPLPPQMAVLAFHEALDERLTTGQNPWLARQLGFSLGEGLGDRRGRPLVSLAHADGVPPTAAALWHRLERTFGAFEMWNPCPPDIPVPTLALANAMRPALVAVAADKGAGLYLTGTLRPSARPMLEQTRMAALGLGHEAIERWGLRWLADALAARFGVELVWLDEGH